MNLLVNCPCRIACWNDKMADRLQRRRVAERIVELRAARKKFLPPEILGEPAWDILLELYVAALDGRTLSIGDFAADTPPSTLRRWLRTLEASGLVTWAKGIIGAEGQCYLTDDGHRALDSLIESLTADLTLR